MKQKTGRKLLSFLLTLAMLVGLMPGMGLTALAYDDDPYASLVGTTTTVKFNDIDWYIIADNSTAVDAGTVTLLAKDPIGASKFNNSTDDGNAYSNSEVKKYLDSLTATGGSFKTVADAITPVTLTIYKYDSTTEVAETIQNAKLWLLSTSEANALTEGVRKCSQASGAQYNYWWLRSPGSGNKAAACVLGAGGVTEVGIGVDKALGVRPALKLNLSSVIFSSVNLSGGANAAISGGTATQNYFDMGLTRGAMTTVTYTANANYKFPETSELYKETNGITVTRTSDTVITVSGTPTADTSITIPDAVVAHTHSFTYSASGAVITATCDNDGCELTDKKATLTLTAPTLTTYGGTGEAVATLTGLDAFNTATSKAIAATEIKYVGRDGTTYAERATAPTDAGKYTAKITLSGVKTGAGDNQSVTASVDYEIAKAATTVTTAPTAGEITYGKTLADSTLTGGTANVAGTFAWKDSTIAPAVSDSENTEYDVVFTPTDGNYATAECKVKLTVIKADASRDVPEKALPYTGQSQPLVNAGTVSGGTLQYALGTDANTAPADGWSTEIPSGTEPGKYYVWYRVVGDENHNGVAPACIVVTIAEPEAVPTEPEAAPAAPESVSDYTLLASMKTSGNKAFKLKWTAVSGAEGYDVFLGDCGGGECELKKTVTGTSCKIGKLKKGNAYAAYVKAWRTENGQKVYIGQASPDVHAVAGGKSNKYTNAKKITVKKKKLTINVGASKKIKASLKKYSNSRRYLNHTAKIRYYSSNRAVATVDAKGKVTGVAPGTCTVYAVAENGLRKGVKITVK